MPTPHLTLLGTKALKMTPSKSRSEKVMNFSNSVMLGNKEAPKDRLLSELSHQRHSRTQALKKNKDRNLLNHRIHKNPLKKNRKAKRTKVKSNG